MMASSAGDFLDASEDLLASSASGYDARNNRNESEDILAGSRSRSQNDLIQSSDDEEEEELSTKEVIQRMQVRLAFYNLIWLFNWMDFFIWQTSWINERFAPDLLPPETQILNCLLDQIRQMERNLSEVGGNKADFRVPIHRMEIARVRFLIASYLRVRLQKIHKFIHTLGKF